MQRPRGRSEWNEVGGDGEPEEGLWDSPLKAKGGELLGFLRRG